MSRFFSMIWIALLPSLVTTWSSCSYAVNMEQLYGSQDLDYIHMYNQRLWKQFLQWHPSLKRCLSLKTQQDIQDKLIMKYPSWGTTYVEKILLRPYVEVFYRSVDLNLPIEKGVRLDLLPGVMLKVLNQNLDASKHKAFELYVDAKGECHVQKITEPNPTAKPREWVYEDGRILKFQASNEVSAKKYPFYGLARARLGDGDFEIIMLEVFNSWLLHPEMRAWVTKHNHEFYQLSLRLSWKSDSQHTVYFPQ